MKDSKIQSFTGLRALALWGVILYHFFPHIFKGGYLGVVVFFCLSGYLLMAHSLEREEAEPFQQFLKRYRRLTPPLLLVVALTCLLALVFFKEDFKDTLFSGLAAIFSLNNWQQILRGFSYFDLHGKFLPFTHFWALSAQVQFYLIWALLQVFFGKNKKKFTYSLLVTSLVSLLVMAILTPFSQDTTRIYYGTDTRFFSFALGALFAMASKQGALKGPQEDKSLHGALLLFVLIFSFIFFKEGPLLYYGGMVVMSLVTCFLLAFIGKEDNSTAQVLTHPFLQYFGLRSYDIYLWQYPLMLVFQNLFSGSTLPYPLLVLLQIPLLLGLSELSYQLFHIEARTKVTWAAGLSLVLIGLMGTSPLAKGEKFLEDPKMTPEKEYLAFQKERGKIQAGYRKEARKEAESPLPEAVSTINKNWSQLALTQEDLEKLKDRDGLLIGDSITAMTAYSIQNLLPKFTIDGEKNRQLFHGKKVLQAHDLTALSDDAPIILQLGTNGDFNPKVLEDLVALCQGREVYLVNASIPDPWEASINKKFQDVAHQSPHVHIIDWYSISKTHQDLFIKDHTHPKDLGIDLFSQTLAKSLVSPKAKTLKHPTKPFPSR